MDNTTEKNTTASSSSEFQDAFLAEVVRETPSPHQPKKKRGRLIVLALAVVVVVAGAATFLFWPRSCFDVDSYTDLVALAQNFDSGDGAELAGVAQDEALFSQPIYFIDGTTDINTDLTEDADELYRQLGAYYQDHQRAAPVSITLEADYVSGTSVDIVKQRMQKVHDNLVSAGVAASSITVNDPTAVVVDEDSLYDEDVLDGMPVGVRVTPISRCQQ